MKILAYELHNARDSGSIHGGVLGFPHHVDHTGKAHLIYYGPHRVLDLHGEGFVIGLQRLFRIQLVVLRSLIDTAYMVAARVKAVLRRTMGQTEEEEESNDDTLSFPGLTVSLSRYEVFYEGKKLEMPPKELEVLYFLASHVNQLFTRGQLLDQVWGFQVEVESRTVDVHVKRLRDKLVGCEKYGWRIQTIWGRGYKFEVIK